MSTRTQPATTAATGSSAASKDEEAKVEERDDTEAEQEDTRSEIDIILDGVLKVLSDTRIKKTSTSFDDIIKSIKEIFEPYKSQKDLYSALMTKDWPKSRYADLVDEAMDSIVDVIFETVPVVKKRKSLRETVRTLASAFAAETTARISADPLLPIRPWADGGWDIVPNRIEEWKRQGRVDSRRAIPDFDAQERIVPFDEAVLWLQWQIIGPASTLVVAISDAVKLPELPLTDAALEETAESIRELGEAIYADLEDAISGKLNEWSAGDDGVFEFRPRKAQAAVPAASRSPTAAAAAAAAAAASSTPAAASTGTTATTSRSAAASGGTAAASRGAAAPTASSGSAASRGTSAAPAAASGGTAASRAAASSSSTATPAVPAASGGTPIAVQSAVPARVAKSSWEMVGSKVEAAASGAPLKAAAVCLNCGKAPRDKFVCSKCSTALYCSKLCQRQHWHTEHKAKCNKGGLAAPL